MANYLIFHFAILMILTLLMSAEAVRCPPVVQSASCLCNSWTMREWIFQRMPEVEEISGPGSLLLKFFHPDGFLV